MSYSLSVLLRTELFLNYLITLIIYII